MLTIVAAMEQELTGVRRALKGQEPMAVQLEVIGIGKGPAQDKVSRLMDSRRWSAGDGLLLLGFAGGLDPALKAGDLLAPTCFYHESGQMLVADGAMWQQARQTAVESSLPVAQGNSLTMDRVIHTPEDKKELYRRHQVGSVNMEDYWVAEVAADANVPFLSVRAVLDPARQVLPKYVLGLAGRPLQAAGQTLRKPWRAPTLLKLAGMQSTARANLARFALAFIHHRPATARQQPLTI